MNLEDNFIAIKELGLLNGSTELIEDFLLQKEELEKKMHLFSVINLTSFMSQIFVDFKINLSSLSSLNFEISPEDKTEIFFSFDIKESFLSDELLEENIGAVNDYLNSYQPKGLFLFKDLMSDHVCKEGNLYFSVGDIDNHYQLESFLLDKLLNKELITIFNKQMLSIDLKESAKVSQSPKSKV